MAKRKIVILGGGMAGLTAAFELTRTEELRRENSVTVYQLGWRLGGKAASGRSADGRILEHGLHIWFGCYDNAFRLLKDVYREWQPLPQNPIKDWREALKAQSYSIFGYRDVGGKDGYHAVTFDTNEHVPGCGGVTESIRDLIMTLYQMARKALEREAYGPGVRDDPGFSMAGTRATEAYLQDVRAAWARTAVVTEGSGESLSGPQAAEKLRATLDAEALLDHAIGVIGFVSPTRRLVWEMMKLAGAVFRGVVTDVVWGGRTIDQLDREEMTAWLRGFGSPLTTENSTLLRTMYDTFFWYEEGDPQRANVGAGTGLAVILRVLCTYKEAITFKMTAGMGEVVVSPLYQVLESRGVRFEFFRKVTRLELDESRRFVRKIHMDRQAVTRDGSNYVPTFEVNDLVCWPAEPHWDQLKDGAALQERGVNFESHWCDERVDTEVLERSPDAEGGERTFTDVVLAVSLGAYKKLNGDAGMCDELLEASKSMRDMAGAIGLVPSQAAQLWLTEPTAALAPWEPGYESVGGPRPQVIWADMSQSLVHEPQASQPGGPLSVHYGCGTYATSLYREPLHSKDTLAAAEREVKSELESWLKKEALVLWPDAFRRSAFDWNVLWDPQGGMGVQRLDRQFTRANVSPTECCPGAEKLSSWSRLRSDESGFDNLFLAGCYIRTGLNTTCIEGAVMSGMQASRAICGLPVEIVGENFARRPVHKESMRPRTETASSTLPLYVSQLEMAQMSHEGPLQVSDIQTHAFLMRARNSAMQALVDKNLNEPAERAGAPLRFKVRGNFTILAFLRAEAAGSVSPTNNVGTMDDREAAFFIPVVTRGDGPRRFMFWVPYLFIDRPIGMTMGREVWGYTKSAAVISLPYDPAPSHDYVVNTTIIEEHDPASRAFDADILRLRRPQEAKADPRGGEGEAIWTDLDQIRTGIRPEGEEAMPGLPLGATLNVVNLKQFRDVEDSRRACYQAVVESPLVVAPGVRGGLLSTRGFELDIKTCDSHKIVEHLGLSATVGQELTTLPVGLGFWARLSFTAEHGRVLWEAR